MERPIRFCDVCKQADDHPRHVIANRDGAPQIRHPDCCASMGCEICLENEQVTKGKRGNDLIKYLAELRVQREKEEAEVK